MMEEDESLREALRRHDPKKHLGVAVHADPLRASLEKNIDDGKYWETIVKEFNSIVVEHHQKWTPLCGDEREGRYDFMDADYIVDWGISHGLEIKGHTLMWHVTSPKWLERKKTPNDLREALRRHIFTTAGHFYGRIHSWDVVNEALAPDGSLAKSIFYKGSGDSNESLIALIDDAFRWARMADPNAELYYNENKVEGCLQNDLVCMNHTRKSNAMFDLVKGMVDRKVPIQGVGLQAHFDAAGILLNRIPHPTSIQINIKRYTSELNLDVNFSEMDVRVSKLPLGIDRDMAQRQIYSMTTDACFRANPKFRGITFWGFTDLHSWVHQFYYQDQPLLFDVNYKKKPAYFGVLDALRGLQGSSSVDYSSFGNGWSQIDPIDDDSIAKRQKKVDEISNAKPDWQQ